MATAGPRYPGTVATEIGPSGDNDWVNPGNVGADDGNEAQITHATYDAGDHSYRLIATNFGFDAVVPDGSTINGITVEIEQRGFAGDAQDQEVRLYDSTGTLVGDDKQTDTSWPGTVGIATYGSSSDTWNSGLDAADIRSAAFGVALIVLANSANTDIGVDFIRVTVDYTAPAPTATGASTVPAATVSGTGELVLTATGAVGSPAPTVAGTGAEVFTATGAATAAAPTVSGSGSHDEAAAPSGSGAVSIPSSTVVGTGVLILTATGAVTTASATVSGTGELAITGTGAITGPAPTTDGTGIGGVVGTGAIVAPTPAVAGSGTGGEDELVAHIGRSMRLSYLIQLATLVEHKRRKRTPDDEEDDEALDATIALLAALLL